MSSYNNYNNYDISRKEQEQQEQQEQQQVKPMIINDSPFCALLLQLLSRQRLRRDNNNNRTLEVSIQSALACYERNERVLNNYNPNNSIKSLGITLGLGLSSQQR